jgi:hypothetical protein
MPTSFEENTEVISLDGKKVGNLRRIENNDYFIIYKKGLLTDEEFRVPTSAVLTGQDSNNSVHNGNLIRLNIREEDLKHGYEFVKGKPNSEFIHGLKKSEPKVNAEKQVIHFEPREPVEESNKTGISSPPLSKQHQAVSKEYHEQSSLYSCDLCPAKFDKADELQKHRGESHKSPVNI